METILQPQNTKRVINYKVRRAPTGSKKRGGGGAGRAKRQEVPP